MERVAALLRQRPALVILDNFESVLGSKPLMPAEELKEVLDAVWAWAPNVAPQTSRILITTRDTTFNDARFGPSKACAHIELGGLATQDALALAAAVLDDHGIDRAEVDREELVALMDHLGGHPLSLYLVLPYLRQHTAAELIARFEELLPGFTKGEALERNESLRVSLEHSLSRLGDETRAALPDLAVFQGGAMEPALLEITEIDPQVWQAARAELEQAALITVESLPGIVYPFLRFHPTLVPYLAPMLSDERRAELEERYWKQYYVVARYLYESGTQHPHGARAIASRELPNLHRALDLAIDAEESEAAVDFATRIARFLDCFGRWREREALMEKVSGMDLTGTEGVTKAELMMLSQRGDALLQQGRAAAAEQLFRGLLAKMQVGMAYGGDEADHDRALTFLYLGRCLKAQGQPAQAIEWHRKALTELERLNESSDSAKAALGVVHTDLGDNLAAVGRFDEAQQAYESGLEISREVSDHRQISVSLGQLGALALRRGDLPEAGRRHTEALETSRALGEPQSEAVAWHQLGMVAQEARDWEEAERCYRESLKLEESLNDQPGVAQTCNQLAIVATGAGRPDDAERWYLRALEGFEHTG